MYCKYCGKPTSDDASFCESCGKPTNGTATAVYAKKGMILNTITLFLAVIFALLMLTSWMKFSFNFGMWLNTDINLSIFSFAKLSSMKGEMSVFADVYRYMTDEVQQYIVQIGACVVTLFIGYLLSAFGVVFHIVSTIVRMGVAENKAMDKFVASFNADVFPIACILVYLFLSGTLSSDLSPMIEISLSPTIIMMLVVDAAAFFVDFLGTGHNSDMGFYKKESKTSFIKKLFTTQSAGNPAAHAVSSAASQNESAQPAPVKRPPADIKPAESPWRCSGCGRVYPAGRSKCLSCGLTWADCIDSSEE